MLIIISSKHYKFAQYCMDFEVTAIWKSCVKVYEKVVVTCYNYMVCNWCKIYRTVCKIA